MAPDDQTAVVVAMELSRCLMAKNLDIDTATTLIALASEDPANWDGENKWDGGNKRLIISVPLDSSGEKD